MKLSEAMLAAEQGKSIHHRNWDKNVHYKIVDGGWRWMNSSGFSSESAPFAYLDGWEIYEEPPEIVSRDEAIAHLKAGHRAKPAKYHSPDWEFYVSIGGSVMKTDRLGKMIAAAEATAFLEDDWVLL